MVQSSPTTIKYRLLSQTFGISEPGDPHSNKDGDFRKRDRTDPIADRRTETRPEGDLICAVAKEMADENATMTFANLLPQTRTADPAGLASQDETDGQLFAG